MAVSPVRGRCAGADGEGGLEAGCGRERACASGTAGSSCASLSAVMMELSGWRWAELGGWVVLATWCSRCIAGPNVGSEQSSAPCTPLSTTWNCASLSTSMGCDARVGGLSLPKRGLAVLAVVSVGGAGIGGTVGSAGVGLCTPLSTSMDCAPLSPARRKKQLGSIGCTGVGWRLMASSVALVGGAGGGAAGGVGSKSCGWVAAAALHRFGTTSRIGYATCVCVFTQLY